MSGDRSSKNHGRSNMSLGLAPPKLTRQSAPQARVASDLDELPPIYVTERDYRRLRSLLKSDRRRTGTENAVLQFLTRELDRAIVRPPAEIPSDAATLRSRVIYRSDKSERPESRALVDDETRSVIGGTISILTPLGVALLGLRAGGMMPYRDRDGRLRMASVDEIAYQPEAQERQLLPPHRYRPNPYAG